MPRFYLMLPVIVVLLVAGSCTAEQPAAPAPQPEFKPTATVRDIMISMVDPNADLIWESVSSLVTDRGIEEKFPKTDEEWAAVRRYAITLLESANLLLVPGRQVAKPGDKAENSNLELEPEEIQALVDGDLPAWMERAHRLHDNTLVALQAIEAKDTQALLFAGDGIDQACEGCHIRYWYPKDSEAVRIYDERMKAEADAK